MKKTPGETAEERANYWVTVIGEARKYPSGVTAYCKDKGVSKNNYYSWFNQLRPSHPEWADLAKDASHAARRARAKRRESARKETEVVERPQRRRFTAAEKAKILQEIESAPAGKINAILRREGLYASHLQKWRRERAEAALVPKKRGPKSDGQGARIKELEKKLARVEKQLKQANVLVRLQKKVAEILETSLPGSEEED